MLNLARLKGLSVSEWGEQFVTSNWEAPFIIWQQKSQTLTDKDIHQVFADKRVRFDREWFAFPTTKRGQKDFNAALDFIRQCLTEAVIKAEKDKAAKARQEQKARRAAKAGQVKPIDRTTSKDAQWKAVLKKQRAILERLK